MTSSKILFFICLSFIVGVVFEFFVKIPQIIIWGFLFVDFIAVIIILLIKKDIFLIFGFCFLFLILGVARMQISEFNIATDPLTKLNGKGEVALTGLVDGAPDIRETSQKLTVKVGNSKMLVTTSNYVEYNYLDKIQITGKLKTPGVIDDFNYTNYLLKDGIYSVVDSPKIEKLGKANGGPAFAAYGFILNLKQKLEQSIQDDFLPPHSLILEGIIFGNNKNMTAELRNKLNAAGLRFLTAISGVHVIILSAILISLLMFLSLKRNYAFLFSIILIWLYVVLTNFTTSGIRAGIMGSVFIFAGALGRQNTSSRIIVLAAALMLLQNPLLLFYDVGFHLSFLACLGIIYLKPLINKFLPDIIATTISAQFLTLPIMVYNFGMVSLVAPITSILILPIMPEILSFGFLFCIFASVSKFLGWIFYVPTWLLVTYFLKVVDIFSQPWMTRNILGISWIWLLFAYAVVGGVIWFLNKKYSKYFL